MDLNPKQRSYLIEEGFVETKTDGLWRRIIGTSTEYIDLTQSCCYGYDNNKWGRRKRNDGPIRVLRKLLNTNDKQTTLGRFVDVETK